ncbi:YlmC/YmxH family sporulation protein [Phosphitispora fastidiosa]|uniref:YlmC/YmxH family sporulation protein n=1 Tax=Phosphitispora fastidiosa TaxID=2837202 RepID=UPI001E468751|nr:YlmC/YmxH family sporulation protein [Phosphitispora fastidiosa]MBU7005600.1 YlmC/YmxH family sporulation protein [Phosphitispora fastidiosa]
MVKISDLRMREVINVLNGKKLGLIKDIEIDLEAGRIRSVVLPGNGRVFSFMGRSDDVVIPWHKIKKLGLDVILVELSDYADTTHNAVY